MNMKARGKTLLDKEDLFLKYGYKLSMKLDTPDKNEYVVQDLKFGKLVRIIEYNLHSKYTQNRLNWRWICHPNILSLYEYFVHDNKLYFVFENHGFNEVGKFFLNNVSGCAIPLGRERENLCKKWSYQCLNGLKHCNDIGLYHTNFNFYKVLLDDDQNAKLANFDDLTYIEPNKTEGCLGKRINSRLKESKNQVWCIGAGLLELLLEQSVYGRNFLLNGDMQSKKELKRTVQQNIGRLQSHLDTSDITDDCKDFLCRSLAYKPLNRMTVDEAMNHVWFFKTEYPETHEAFPSSCRPEHSNVDQREWHDPACFKTIMEPPKCDASRAEIPKKVRWKSSRTAVSVCLSHTSQQLSDGQIQSASSCELSSEVQQEDEYILKPDLPPDSEDYCKKDWNDSVRAHSWVRCSEGMIRQLQPQVPENMTQLRGCDERHSFCASTTQVHDCDGREIKNDCPLRLRSSKKLAKTSDRFRPEQIVCDTSAPMKLCSAHHVRLDDSAECVRNDSVHKITPRKRLSKTLERIIRPRSKVSDARLQEMASPSDLYYGCGHDHGKVEFKDMTRGLERKPLTKSRASFQLHSEIGPVHVGATSSFSHVCAKVRVEEKLCHKGSTNVAQKSGGHSYCHTQPENPIWTQPNVSHLPTSSEINDNIDEKDSCGEDTDEQKFKLSTTGISGCRKLDRVIYPRVGVHGMPATPSSSDIYTEFSRDEEACRNAQIGSAVAHCYPDYYCHSPPGCSPLNEEFEYEKHPTVVQARPDTCLSWKLENKIISIGSDGCDVEDDTTEKDERCREDIADSSSVAFIQQHGCRKLERVIEPGVEIDGKKCPTTSTPSAVDTDFSPGEEECKTKCRLRPETLPGVRVCSRTQIVVSATTSNIPSGCLHQDQPEIVDRMDYNTHLAPQYEWCDAQVVHKSSSEICQELIPEIEESQCEEEEEYFRCVERDLKCDTEEDEEVNDDQRYMPETNWCEVDKSNVSPVQILSSWRGDEDPYDRDAVAHRHRLGRSPWCKVDEVIEPSTNVLDTQVCADNVRLSDITEEKEDEEDVKRARDNERGCRKLTRVLEAHVDLSDSRFPATPAYSDIFTDFSPGEDDECKDQTGSISIQAKKEVPHGIPARAPVISSSHQIQFMTISKVCIAAPSQREIEELSCDSKGHHVQRFPLPEDLTSTRITVQSSSEVCSELPYDREEVICCQQDKFVPRRSIETTCSSPIPQKPVCEIVRGKTESSVCDGKDHLRMKEKCHWCKHDDENESHNIPAVEQSKTIEPPVDECALLLADDSIDEEEAEKPEEVIVDSDEEEEKEKGTAKIFTEGSRCKKLGRVLDARVGISDTRFLATPSFSDSYTDFSPEEDCLDEHDATFLKQSELRSPTRKMQRGVFVMKSRSELCVVLPSTKEFNTGKVNIEKRPKITAAPRVQPEREFSPDEKDAEESVHHSDEDLKKNGKTEDDSRCKKLRRVVKPRIGLSCTLMPCTPSSSDLFTDFCPDDDDEEEDNTALLCKISDMHKPLCTQKHLPVTSESTCPRMIISATQVSIVASAENVCTQSSCRQHVDHHCQDYVEHHSQEPVSVYCQQGAKMSCDEHSKTTCRDHKVNCCERCVVPCREQCMATCSKPCRACSREPSAACSREPSAACSCQPSAACSYQPSGAGCCRSSKACPREPCKSSCLEHVKASCQQVVEQPHQKHLNFGCQVSRPKHVQSSHQDHVDAFCRGGLTRNENHIDHERSIKRQEMACPLQEVAGLPREPYCEYDPRKVEEEQEEEFKCEMEDDDIGPQPLSAERRGCRKLNRVIGRRFHLTKAGIKETPATSDVYTEYSLGEDTSEACDANRKLREERCQPRKMDKWKVCDTRFSVLAATSQASSEDEEENNILRLKVQSPLSRQQCVAIPSRGEVGYRWTPVVACSQVYAQLSTEEEEEEYGYQQGENYRRLQTQRFLSNKPSKVVPRRVTVKGMKAGETPSSYDVFTDFSPDNECRRKTRDIPKRNVTHKALRRLAECTLRMSPVVEVSDTRIPVIAARPDTCRERGNVDSDEEEETEEERVQGKRDYIVQRIQGQRCTTWNLERMTPSLLAVDNTRLVVTSSSEMSCDVAQEEFDHCLKDETDNPDFHKAMTERPVITTPECWIPSRLQGGSSRIAIVASISDNCIPYPTRCRRKEDDDEEDNFKGQKGCSGHQEGCRKNSPKKCEWPTLEIEDITDTRHSVMPSLADICSYSGDEFRPEKDDAVQWECWRTNVKQNMPIKDFKALVSSPSASSSECDNEQVSCASSSEPFEEREGQELSPLVSDPDDKDDWIIRWRNVIEDDSYRLLSTMSLPPIPEEDEEEGAHSIGSAEIFSAEEMKLQPLEDFQLLSERKSDVDSAILTLILNMVLLVLAIVILKNVYRVLFKEPLNGPQKLDEQ